MMWEVLGIEPTTDKRAIKRAYARLTAKYHPEEYPEEFKQIHEAYQQALQYADNGESVHIESQESLRLHSHLREHGSERQEYEQKNRKDEREDGSGRRTGGIDFEELVLNRDTHEERYVPSPTEEKMDFKELLGHERQREPVRDQKEEIDFGKLQEEDSMKKVSLKQEEEIDFAALESMEDEEEWVDPDWKRTNEKREEPKQSKSYAVASVVWLILMLVLWVGLRVAKVYLKSVAQESEAVDAIAEMLVSIPEKIFGEEDALEDQLKDILEKKYKAEFEVTAIDVPDNFLEIYYLMAPGKTEADYQWFLVHSKDEVLETDFYASWSEEDNFCYDYGYRQMFAAIDYVGLSAYVDDKDNYNVDYYKKGEQRYCYPVLFIEGQQEDVFYDRVEQCVNLIEDTDAVFENHDHATLNFINPHSQAQYNLEIRKGENCDRETMQTQLDNVACSSYMQY
ncbi:MAG: J domain-containing protein [Lachnospiraceae bacterium]